MLLVTGHGSGDGSGDGTGDGTGDGSGDGTGDGTGDGSGDGVAVRWHKVTEKPMYSVNPPGHVCVLQLLWPWGSNYSVRFEAVGTVGQCIAPYGDSVHSCVIWFRV
jgi:hypothetical protein